MPQIIDYDKPTRVFKENDAAFKLQQTLKRAPTQDEIYEQAYGTRFPVFKDDFDYFRIQEQLPKQYQEYLDAPEKFATQLTRPNREVAYGRKVRKALKGVGFETRQALMGSALGARQRDINNEVQNRTNALGKLAQLQQIRLQPAKEQFDLAYNTAAGNEQAYAQQQAQQADFQNQLALLTFKAQLDGSGGRSGGGRGYGAKPVGPEAGITSLAQSILDGTFDPADLSYDLQAPVYAEIGRLMSENAALPPAETVNQQAPSLTAGLFPDNTRVTAEQYGQGLRDTLVGSAQGLGQGLRGFGSGVVNLFKGLLGR